MKGEFSVITEALITNMVIVVSIVVLALMALLVVQIYKSDSKNGGGDSQS